MPKFQYKKRQKSIVDLWFRCNLRIKPFLHLSFIYVAEMKRGPRDQIILLVFFPVFKCESSKLLLVQIRSSVSKVKKEEFVADLLKWASELGVVQVIALASFAADERIDSQIVGVPLRFLTNDEDKKDELKALKWRELERKKAGGDDDDLYIPGGGLAKTVHKRR